MKENPNSGKEMGEGPTTITSITLVISYFSLFPYTSQKVGGGGHAYSIFYL